MSRLVLLALNHSKAKDTLNKNSQFIVVEGGEGVGKTHFCRGLERQLKADGRKVWLTKEPGGTSIANDIRKLFLSPPATEKLQPLAELLLVSAARVQHVAKISEEINAGTTVICDRFTDSTMVYQGVLGGIDEKTISYFNECATDKLHPGLTILLDCPVEIAQDRLKARDKLQQPETRFDGGSFQKHETIRNGFLKLTKNKPNSVVIDASLSPDEVLNEGLKILKERVFES